MTDDRSLVVRLRAEIGDFKRNFNAAGAEVNSFSKDLDGAAKSAKKTGDQTQDTAKRANTALGQMAQSASKHQREWTQVGTALVAVGVAAAAGVGLAVKSFADFDKEMSNTAALGDDAAASLNELREAAMQAGRDTAYSAQEAAGGVTELMKAGVSAADVLGGGLTGALDLAAAGELGVADAAKIAATTMTQFKLKGEDVTKVADAFASAANNAQGSVQDVSLAMSYAGIPAAALGVTMEETAGLIGLFAKNGITGEKAGTAFRGMLVQMQKPTSAATAEMERLNISFFDAEGRFVGMEGVAGQLQTSLAGASEQQRGLTLATLFGTEALGAATALYNGGAPAVAEWTETVSQSGYASEVAATKLDNLAGDLKILQGSFETALISLGAGADGPLRSMTQGLTEIVNTVGAMDPAMQTAALAVGGTVAAVGLLSGGFLLMAPRIVETRKALDVLSTSMPRLVGAMRALKAAALPIGGLLAAGAIGFSLWASAQKEASARTQELADALDQQNGALTENSTAWISSELTKDQSFGIKNTQSMIEAADEMGISVETLTRAYEGQPAAMLEAKNAAQEYSDANFSLSQAQQGLALTFIKNIDDQSSRLTDAQKIVEAKKAIDKEAAGAQTELAEGYDFTTGTIEGQTDALDDLIDLQAKAAGVVLSERDAQRALEAAYDDVDEALEQQISTLASHLESLGQTKEAARANAEAQVKQADKLDISTEAGRNNQAALDDISKAGWDLIESMKANGASQESIQKTMQTTRDRFIAVAQKMGLSKDAAKALATELNLIPENVRSQVQIDTENADKALQAFLNKNRKITIGTGFAAPGRGVAIREAAGGAISGPGTGTSDEIPAWLSNGEHVLTAREVQQAGGQDAIYRMRQSIMDGSLRFAGGGGVSLSPIKDTRVAVHADMTGVQNGLAAYSKQNANFSTPIAGGGSSAGLVAWGRSLLARGFSVGEHSLFGGVRGGHMVGSKHYRDGALDINAGAGTSLAEQRRLALLVAEAAMRGLRTLFMVRGHFGHLHAEVPYLNGGYTGEAGGRVHPREYVVKASSTAKYGTHFLDSVNAGRFNVAPAPVANPTGPVLNVTATADAPLAAHYAEQVARATVNRFQDAMSAYGIGGR